MKKRVDVGDLRLGMYVAQLDRPWLETPFLFQGFELRSQEELDQLRQHCQYVYIDTEQGPDLHGAKGARQLPPRTKIIRVEEERLRREFRELLQSPERRGKGVSERKRPAYQDQAPLEQEVSPAREIEAKVREMMDTTLDDVRRGKPIDTEGAKKVVDQMVDSIVRNPDALVGLTRIALDPGLYKSSQGVPVEEELERARAIKSKAREILDGALEKAEADELIDAESAAKVVDDMVASVERNPDSLVVLSQAKDVGQYTALHSIRTCILALAFGRHMALTKEQLTLLGMGALFHDVGMVKLPAHILEKPVGLTKPEFALMKSHVRQGVDLLTQAKGFPPEALQLVEQHHERHDGSGYPKKLNGELIGMSGSIGAIVDVYDAITSQRIYRGGISPEDALRRMYEWRHKDFHPELVEEFIKCMGIFPIGSLVELNTGGIGVVITINRQRRLKPKVALVLQANKEPYAKRVIADLAEHRDRLGRELRIRRVLPAGTYGINPVEHIALL